MERLSKSTKWNHSIFLNKVGKITQILYRRNCPIKPPTDLKNCKTYWFFPCMLIKITTFLLGSSQINLKFPNRKYLQCVNTSLFDYGAGMKFSVRVQIQENFIKVMALPVFWNTNKTSYHLEVLFVILVKHVPKSVVLTKLLRRTYLNLSLVFSSRLSQLAQYVPVLEVPQNSLGFYTLQLFPTLRFYPKFQCPKN